jgi:hypothetical protein
MDARILDASGSEQKFHNGNQLLRPVEVSGMVHLIHLTAASPHTCKSERTFLNVLPCEPYLVSDVPSGRVICHIAARESHKGWGSSLYVHALPRQAGFLGHSPPIVQVDYRLGRHKYTKSLIFENTSL